MKNLRHGTWVAIADGAKALVLRNDGESDALNFSVIDIFTNSESLRTSDLGTDRPGRTQQSAAAGRASLGQADWHEIGEHRFAVEFAEALEKRCEAGEFSRLVVVAPPRTLADLRKHYSKRIQAAIIAEIDKDLTNHPLYKIERILLTS
jgi:protein required for attachment to host cells